MKKFLLEEIRTKQYENNIERYGEYSDTCICCGKRTVEKYSIQMTTDGYLVDADYEVKNSQGFFSIGKICLNKFNKKAK
jgi:hypothetical protein